MVLTLHSSIYKTAACVVNDGSCERLTLRLDTEKFLAMLSAYSNQQAIFSFSQHEVLWSRSGTVGC
jgi:hypothetical protein